MVNYTFSSYCGFTALQTSNGIANKQWRSHPNSRQTLTAHHAHSCMVWVASDRHGYACVCVCVGVCVCVCVCVQCLSLSPAPAGQWEYRLFLPLTRRSGRERETLHAHTLGNQHRDIT